MKTKWGLELPDRILSLTGAATEFDNKDKIKKYLQEIVTQSKNIWIITGGSNSGVNFCSLLFS